MLDNIFPASIRANEAVFDLIWERRMEKVIQREERDPR